MKAFPIRYSQKALSDLLSVWDDVYEASKEPETADKYTEGLMEAIAGKKEFPLSGSPLLYGDLFTGYYYVNYKKYKFFYRVKDETIDVVRILMCKRDYMKILFDEDEI